MTFINRLPYGAPGSPKRAAWHAEEERLNAELRTRCEADAGTQNWPVAARDALFSAAWERGHSSGREEVAVEYPELVSVAVDVLKGFADANGLRIERCIREAEGV